MEVAVCIRRAIIIHDDVDSLYIDSSSEDISRHEDSLLEGFERGVTFDSEIRLKMGAMLV